MQRNDNEHQLEYINPYPISKLLWSGVPSRLNWFVTSEAKKPWSRRLSLHLLRTKNPIWRYFYSSKEIDFILYQILE